MQKLSKFFILLVLVFTPFLPLVAQESGDKLNASILPTVWFSELDVREGEEVRVFAAVRNNSEINVAGDVVFYIDGEELARAQVALEPDTLRDVSVVWTATGGTHTFNAVLLSEMPEGQELLSTETGEAELYVEREVTIEEVKEVTESTIRSVVSKVDEAANTLADKLEARASIEAPTSVEAEESQVLGTATTTVGDDPSIWIAGFLRFLAFLAREWMWTLAGLTVLVLIWSFRG